MTSDLLQILATLIGWGVMAYLAGKKRRDGVSCFLVSLIVTPLPVIVYLLVVPERAPGDPRDHPLGATVRRRRRILAAVVGLFYVAVFAYFRWVFFRA